MATSTFNYTGAIQTFTVPADVYHIVCDVRAAAGAGHATGAGGSGAKIVGTITVTPGEVINIWVGGGGGISSGGTGGTGGLGGTAGGRGGNGTSSGEGGGGASDIRQGGALDTNRILVAGAGAGGGALSTSAAPNGGTTLDTEASATRAATQGTDSSGISVMGGGGGGAGWFGGLGGGNGTLAGVNGSAGSSMRHSTATTSVTHTPGGGAVGGTGAGPNGSVILTYFKEFFRSPGDGAGAVDADTVGNILTANESGFETSAPAGWTAGANTTLAQETTIARTGTKSLRATSTNTSAQGIYQPMKSATPGLTYRFDVWLRAGVASHIAQLFLSFFASNGTTVLGQTQGNGPPQVVTIPTGSFVFMSISGLAPAGTFFVQGAIAYYSNVSGRIVYLDDAVLEVCGVSRIATFPRAAGDVAGEADSLARTFTGARSMTDLGGALDSLARIYTANRSRSDVAAATDVLLRQVAFNRTLGPEIAAAIGDTITRQFSAGRSITDIARALDSLARVYQGTRFLADGDAATIIYNIFQTVVVDD